MDDARDAHGGIASGQLRGAALRDRILRVPPAARDAWIDDVLALESWVEDIDLPPGGVPYLPCPIAPILAAVSRSELASDDVFVDLGAGLGRVAILAHLLTGATAIGIEAQRHLVERGQHCCNELGLDRVRLVHGDASELALDGTVFFLYSPFNGPTLARVVNRLESIARRHPLTICAVDVELKLRGLVRLPEGEPALSVYRTP